MMRKNEIARLPVCQFSPLTGDCAIREREETEAQEDEKWDSRFGVLLKAFFFEITPLCNFLLMDGVLSSPIPLHDAHQNEDDQSNGNSTDHTHQPVRLRQVIHCLS